MKRNQWSKAFCLGLAVFTAAGCMSREDRIRDVVSHEVEKCKEAEGDFYEVTAHDGSKFRILAEFCHLELSGVEMNNEWTGNLTTGPLVWTAGEDQESRAMVITRVAWTEFDRAMRYRGQRDPGVDELRAAETNFAAAEAIYGESGWLRLERLQNLIDLRGAMSREVENPASIGEEARAYFDELVEWAAQNGDAATEAKARLAVWRFLNEYRDRQQRGIGNLGGQDRRIQAAIEHAEKEGDRETLAAYQQELEERMARRPIAQAEMEERMALAEREMCELRRGLSVTGITDDQLRSRITAALRHDCAAALAVQEGVEEEEVGE